MAQPRSETSSSGSAVPTKCRTCEALQQVPFACEDCHQLLAHVQGADYFELFGLPRTYDLDVTDMETKYLAISRNIHPDKFAMAGDEMQAFALRSTAAVNNAYDVLRDPIHRAEYLLEAAGGPSATQDKRAPQDLLSRIMRFREEVEEARACDDRAAIDSIRDQVMRERRLMDEKVAGLCRDLPNASEEAKGELRLLLNAMKYIDNLLGQL